LRPRVSLNPPPDARLRTVPAARKARGGGPHGASRATAARSREIAAHAPAIPWRFREIHRSDLAIHSRILEMENCSLEIQNRNLAIQILNIVHAPPGTTGGGGGGGAGGQAGGAGGVGNGG
jgi:hypothetical protein